MQAGQQMVRKFSGGSVKIRWQKSRIGFPRVCHFCRDFGGVEASKFTVVNPGIVIALNPCNAAQRSWNRGICIATFCDRTMPSPTPLFLCIYLLPQRHLGHF